MIVANGNRRSLSPPLTRFITGDNAKLAAIWLAVTAYNLCKPYHIDDAVHLEIAHWIAAHPLHPMSGELNYGGVAVPFHELNQPPLYFYCLAVWGSLFGYGEATMHALQALFALAAIVLFHRTARCLAPANALWLSAMLALGPAFVVEQNLMVDVPLLALWLWFFDALILGADSTDADQPRRLLTAALACSAAMLVKYSSLVLVPILLVVIAIERRWRRIWYGLLPLVVLAAWSLFNEFDYGGIHIAERPAHVFKYSSYAFYLPLFRGIALLVTIAAVTPFGLIAVARLAPAARHLGPALYAAAVTLFALLVAGVAVGSLDAAAADRVLRGMLLGNAAMMIVAAAVVVYRRLSSLEARFPLSAADTRMLILLLWIAGHVAFYCLYAPFMAVRHVLLLLPAVLLLIGQSWPERLPRLDAAFGVLASLFLSLTLGFSDWHFAAFFRDEPAAIRASLPAGARIWFVGGMGWRWYASRAGLLSVDDATTQLAPGEFLAVPRDQGPVTMRHQPRLSLVRTDSKPLIWADLFCTGDPARFYATPFTDFTEGPWLLTRSCDNFIDLYRVE